MPFADPFEEEPETLFGAMSRQRWHKLLTRHKLLICSALTTGAICSLLISQTLLSVCAAIGFLFLLGLTYMLAG